jgi:hypothetical protein
MLIAVYESSSVYIGSELGTCRPYAMHNVHAQLDGAFHAKGFGRDHVTLRCEVDLRIQYRRKTKLPFTSHTSRVIMCLQSRNNKSSQYHPACCDILLSTLQSYLS